MKNDKERMYRERKRKRQRATKARHKMPAEQQNGDRNGESEKELRKTKRKRDRKDVKERGLKNDRHVIETSCRRRKSENLVKNTAVQRGLVAAGLNKRWH